MFGSRRRLKQDAKPEMAPMPMEQAPAPARRGLFGRGPQGIFRRADGDPGTLANYFLLGTNGVQGIRDSRMQRDMFGMRVRAQKQEEAQAEQERQQREAAIGALPENLRPLAPFLTNEGITRAVMPPEPEYEIDALGRPYTVQGGRVQYGEGRVAVPERGGAGGGQYRPITPEEARAYGITNPTGFAMAPNGRPVRVGAGGTFSPDQRARVEIGLDPAMEAVQALDELETGLTPEELSRSQGTITRRSPRNQQWGASVVDMMDGDGTSAMARNWGGPEFQRYTSAGSAFESGLLPILSGAAVTDSEARRMIRAALPQLGDGPDVLAEKARRRRQMINGAAIIGGREPPFPQDAVPTWATRAAEAYGNAGAGADFSGMPQSAVNDGITPDEWEVMTPEERALWSQ